MSENKFYIVIPTRNRHDTLEYSIKTALNQSYDNLEVVVSDNCSSQDTENVVRSFTDSRLRYQRSNQSLCMVNSWEFAISKIGEPGYVHVMGDDNGILPDAVSTVNRLVEETSAQVVLSDVTEFHWPSTSAGSSLNVPITSSEVYWVDSKKALERAYNLDIGFSRLPTINSGFVHTSIINTARRNSGGRYFLASNPDVYSAVINAFYVKKYLYSRRPLVVNGASSHSNGASAQTAGKVSQFILDNLRDGYVYHECFVPSTSYYLNVYEAFAVAADVTGYIDFRKQFNFRKLRNKLVTQEYLAQRRFWLLEDINEFCFKNRLPVLDVQPSQLFRPSVVDKLTTGSGINNGNYFINNETTIPNVQIAADVASRILNNKRLGFKDWMTTNSVKQYLKGKLLRILLNGKVVRFDYRN